ncbi:hypothetical protein PPROV_000932900 [Pycnococcus provasolii]|uniref:Uncharacterized protein n=2 Tax=Pycnococcus provasolii TaxID=41880 RepID=A0A830HUG4_9CHLO|nr:hypothetical protein PPROV_000932900 [Pycnococcus provasolii]
MAFWGAWTPPQVVRCAAARPASPPYLYYAGGVYLFSLATQRFAKMVRRRRQRAKLGGGGASSTGESSALASAARSIASRHWDFGFWERAAAGTVLGRSMLSNTQLKRWFFAALARAGDDVRDDREFEEYLGAVIAAYFDEAEKVNVRADIAFCHAMLYTGWFRRCDRSCYAFGDELWGGAKRHDTMDAGVRAHVAALAATTRDNALLRWEDLRSAHDAGVGRSIAALYRQIHYETAYIKSP